MTATFEAVRARYDVVPIRHCPGRYVVRGVERVAPEQVAGEGTMARRYVGCSSDPVWVVPLATGGLISYEKTDGAFVHTLCDDSGFARKLAQLGISL